MKRGPEEAWNELKATSGNLVKAYGANSRLVEEFLKTIDHLPIKQWVY